MSDTNTPPGDAPAPQADPKADTLTLTQADLDARIAAALKADRDAAAEQKRKDDEAAEAAEAEKRGEHEKIAAAEKAKREKAEGELLTLKRDLAVRDALAEHPDYATCAKYIAPLVDAGASDLAKAAKDAVSQYVADNPRTPKGSAGAPPAPRGGARMAPGRIPNQRVSTPGVAASRF